MPYKITKSLVECYKLRDENGYWAVITIDPNENSGRIQIASDFGNWQNFWGACGTDFKTFLLKLNMEYVADKFKADQFFNAKETVEHYHEIVKESELKPKQREAIEEEISRLAYYSQEDSFIKELEDCENLLRLTDGNASLIHGVDPLFKRFWEGPWAKFREVIAEELQQSTNP